MAYKLPYIPDKRLYAAVMGACSYVCSTGWFNKATEYYANKYGVDVEQVRKYVRMAQGNGQKKKNASRTPRKYFWFAVEFSMGNERNGCDHFEPSEARYCVQKGLTVESVKKRLSMADDMASEYSACHWFGRVAPFDTKEEAEQVCKEWRLEYEQARLA